MAPPRDERYAKNARAAWLTGQAADVQCPAKTIILFERALKVPVKVNDSFTCPVLVGSDRQKVTLTVAWKVQP